MQFFNHAEGYVTPNGSGYDYVYQYKDHLGNVRLSYMDANNNGSVTTDEIVEESNYYPFGLQHKGYGPGISSLGNDVAKKFKYQGQELTKSLGYEMYEFELRHYDATIGRFITADPYEQFHSPYVAMGNNPVVSFDPDGGKCYDGNGNVVACPDSEIYDDYRESDEKHITVLGEVEVSNSDSNFDKGKREFLRSEDVQVEKFIRDFPAIWELSGWDHFVAEMALNLQGYRVEQGEGGNYNVGAEGNVISGPYLAGLGAAGLIGGGPKKIPKIKLNTSSVTRRQAFRKAKIGNKVPRSKQPDRVFNVREKGTGKLLKVYEYTNSSGKKILIRGDNAKIYKDGGIQGRHFNAGQKGTKLKQHHYYDN
ncbi:hypothetical protein OOZ15_19470 [Galbibacter sp. EGI 63066]|uniref:RHS repeat domain-containing protein n=1 Tax=Galbibacter sp. EGI 63066 TaxID=2993559 RepID=UPI002249946C|nr:RHS repeat-associated core domain-containing protein [Galbibacter sp. EGI 63066]MCX2682135.1 hypothetical protein [Galbibacter sp. EGI 63066]